MRAGHDREAEDRSGSEASQGGLFRPDGRFDVGRLRDLSEALGCKDVFPIPDGISIETPSQTEILVKGMDRQMVGQVAAKIRGFRPPEPYKGKGVRYAGEKIELKEAKKK